jgi:hypothetical protein
MPRGPNSFHELLPPLLELLVFLCFTMHSCRRQRKAALEQEHTESWSVGAASLKQGVAELCLYKVVSLQAALADLSATYVFTKWLQEHIGPLRKQHRRLDGHLDSLRIKMGVQVQQLLDWVPQLRCYQQHLRVDSNLQAALAATAVGDSVAGDTQIYRAAKGCS